MSLRNSLRRLTGILFRRPNGEDFRSIGRASPWGAAVTATNAVVFALANARTPSGPALSVWCLGTVTIALVVLRRSLRARSRAVSEVSLRTVRRLHVFVLLMALPWVALGSILSASPSPWERSLGLIVLVGMASGGVLMLHRVMSAVVVYCTSILFTACGFLFSVDGIAAWPIVVYAGLFATMLFVSAHVAGEMSRERDRSLDALSAANDEIRRLAQEDGLTGLMNREALLARLDELTAHGHGGRPFTLFMLDLDRFKNVNDSYGHPVGDGLLKVVAQRLKGAVRGGDLVSRLGGDEFAVVMPGVASPGTAERWAGRLLSAINAPAEVMGQLLYPGTSVGGAEYPVQALTGEELLLTADISLNAAKEDGRGTFVAYDPDLAQRVEDEERMASELRDALDRDEFRVEYQPKIGLMDGMLAGSEALIRWDHPTRGTLGPDAFLGVAAERGLAPVISERVFQRVAADVSSWRREGTDPGPVSVNLHAVDIKSPERLIDRMEALADLGLGRRDLVLEVTEGCVVGRGTDQASKLIARLRKMGYDISLDDFGTGHASLSHLKSLPVNEIKIDKSFVTGLGDSRPDAAIVAAIVALGRGLGLRIVAEGVETEAHRWRLIELGVDIGQGFLWSPALPADRFARFAAARRARHIARRAVT